LEISNADGSHRRRSWGREAHVFDPGMAEPSMWSQTRF
jgi:hypothetical protein